MPGAGSIRTALLGLSAAALGVAIHEANGTLTPDALRSLGLACILALLALLSPRGASVIGSPVPFRRPEWLRFVLVTIVAYEAGFLASSPPALYARLGAEESRSFVRATAALTALACTQAFAPRRLRALLFAGLVLGHAAIAVWLLHASPAPNIDVFYFQREGCAALLRGENPYAMTFPNIYGDATPFYGPNLSVNGRLQFGFVYPPLSLLLALPGHLLGDFRFSQLFAVEAAAVLIALLWRDGVGNLAAALFLLTPRVFFVLEQGWTEPYVVLLLSATVYAAYRAPRATAYLAGLLLSVKQYLVFAFVPCILLVPRRDWRAGAGFLARAALAGTVVTLPMMLWNVHAFWRDVVQLQLLQPLRTDALSYMVWLSLSRPTPLPAWLCFAGAGVTTAIALWRVPKNPAGFALSIAVISLAFFALSKQAFANYYFFVIGALCCAAAGQGLPLPLRGLERREAQRSPPNRDDTRGVDRL